MINNCLEGIMIVVFREVLTWESVAQIGSSSEKTLSVKISSYIRNMKEMNGI